MSQASIAALFPVPSKTFPTKVASTSSELCYCLAGVLSRLCAGLRLTIFDGAKKLVETSQTAYEEECTQFKLEPAVS